MVVRVFYQKPSFVLNIFFHIMQKPLLKAFTDRK